MARLLLDEQLPRRLRFAIPLHTVRTVREMGWAGLRNGTLLRRAEANFDVFVTMDKGIPFQQVIGNLSIGVLIVRARSNSFLELGPHAEDIGAAAAAIASGVVGELDLRRR